MGNNKKTHDKFINRLKKLRELSGWSQRDLAKEFRVSPGAVALWENGSRRISGPICKLIEIYEGEFLNKIKGHSFE